MVDCHGFCISIPYDSPVVGGYCERSIRLDGEAAQHEQSQSKF